MKLVLGRKSQWNC